MTILKPVSQAEREWLALMGQKPEDHQHELLLKKTRPSRLSPAELKAKERAKFNKLVETQITSTTPIGVLVGQMKVEPENIIWRAYHYAIFEVHETCRNCLSTRTYMDESALFLAHKQVGRNADPTAWDFRPVKEIEFPHFETRKILSSRRSLFCLSCFSSSPSIKEIIKCQALVPSPSSQESITPTSSDSTVPAANTSSSPSTSQSPAPSTTSLEASVITPFPPGKDASSSGKSDFEQLVNALDSPSSTNELSFASPTSEVSFNGTP